MDYSILVGVDETNNQLVVGIIDYMRVYTWDKHLESWVKSTPGILAGTGKKPTVISPDRYKNRFREANWLYFPMTPTSKTKIVLLEPSQKSSHLAELIYDNLAFY